MHRNLLIVFILAVTVCISPENSCAQQLQEGGRDSGEEGRRYGQDGDWSIRLGAFGILSPKYEGSHQYEVKAFPLIDITWKERIFLNARKGLGAYVWKGPDIKLGLSVAYTFGRDEDDAHHLNGLKDVEGGATANALFEWDIDDFSVDAQYEHQITGDETGFQVHLGLGYRLRMGRKFILKPSIKTTFASSNYMEAYFGISSRQSARSGLPEYDADAGFKTVGARLMAIYRLSRHWGIQLFTGYDRLVGDAEDSPVVQDENQYRVGLGISYRLL